MAMKTGLEGKPWYYGLGIGLGVGVVLYFLAQWQYLGPIQDNINGQEAHLEELQHKVQEGKSAEAQLPKFREEVHQLELELDKLLRILPASRRTPDLLRRIRHLAEQGDFNLKDFRPGVLTDKEFYSEWPITVDLDGTYHNLALFFDRIGRFSRIINITEMQVVALPPARSVKGQAVVPTINATFVAKTFVYKEPDTSAPKTPAKPGGGIKLAPPPGAPAPKPAGGGE
jgi:type IV pilus assembly protein PilO